MRDARSSDINDYNRFVSRVANSIPEVAALGTTWSALVSTAATNVFANAALDPAASSLYGYITKDPVSKCYCAPTKM